MLKGFVLGVIAVVVVLPTLVLAGLGLNTLANGNAVEHYREMYFECNGKRLEAEYKLSHRDSWENLPDVPAKPTQDQLRARMKAEEAQQKR